MRRWFLALALLAAWLWWRDDGAPAQHAALQAAVLHDGFAVYDGHRVVELGRDGKERTQHALAHDGELRLVGSAGGPVAAWVESQKLKLVRVSTGQDAVWGRQVRMLCEGRATNDDRFAVAYLEGDDTIWFVHGDTQRRTALSVEEPVEVAHVDPKGWCGIASAGDLIALLWRDRDRLLIQTCTRKKCGGVTASVAFGREETLLGFGCVRNACLLAARDRSNQPRLQLVTESGSTKWRAPLNTRVMDVSIVGAGPDAFAVGFIGPGGAEVGRVDRKGTVTPLWSGPAREHPPALAWSRDLLLVTSPGGAPAVVPLPR